MQFNMNPAQRIIRVSRVEGNESCLVSVTKNGNRPLDVKLVATEGENAFTGTGKSRSGASVISSAMASPLQLSPVI